ncbi:unnamed protein product, partial [Rotaria magnacalcarata]
MSKNNTNADSSIGVSYSVDILSSIGKFWLYLILLITVVFSQFTVYPWMLYYFYHINNWSRSYAFHFIWGLLIGQFMIGGYQQKRGRFL